MTPEQRAGADPKRAPAPLPSDLGDARLTETANPRTAAIDDEDAAGIVHLIAAEDARVPAAVASQAAAIADLIDRVVDRLRSGGRLIYVGAGTSGRLGVLDAAECPPTFGTDPSLVRGIVAGGPAALVRSREGVEDDEEAAREAVREIEAGERDFVLGIATSGTTPFVRAALEAARRAGAGTGFLCCTPPPPGVAALADVVVTPLVGPEVIAGSTRMKAGTATKLVLNTLTTGVMIRLGKVYGNLMVDLRAVSEKLVDRSLRILEAVTGASREEARRVLVAAGGSVKTAILMREAALPRADAERRLDAADGFLRRALAMGGEGGEVPHYAHYEPGTSADVARVLARLAGAADRVRRALAEGEGSSAGRGRAGWGPDRQLGHLVAFETEAVRPRIEALREADGIRLPEWDGSVEPPSGRLAELMDRFEAERSRTLELLPEPGDAVYGHRGTIGEETVTTYQFLRGVAQHDDAHAARLAERIHPSLRDAVSG